MKRLASFLLILLLLLSLVGCNTPDTPDVSPGAGATTTTTTVRTDDGDTTAATDGTTSATDAADSGTVTQKPTSTTTTTTNKKPTTTTTTTTTSNAEKLLVDKAFGLTGSATLKATLTGTVVSVEESYSSNYGNATFTIRVEGTGGAKNLYCYRCKPAGQTDVAVGHTVTLTGTVKNYKGTIEFDKASYTVVGGTTTTTRPLSAADMDENGIYDSKEEVALYIHLYGKLPKNYVSKDQYDSLGRPKDKCAGGDRFGNYERLLPSGYTYYECDIGTLGKSDRGAKRLVYTKSGIVYYTSDHYESFTQLYGER